MKVLLLILLRKRWKRVNAAGNTVKDYTLAFEIGQRSDSLYVLNLIVNTLGWGKVYTETRGISKFRLVPRDLIINDLVPFFDKYPVLGIKNLDYLDFKLVANIIKKDEHLTNEGLSKIKIITLRMNLNRTEVHSGA